MQDRPETKGKALYDGDFYAWSLEQARLVREQRFGELGLENVAEELEAVGNSVKREIEARSEILCVLLLRWRHQPELRGRGWSSTILAQRLAIADLIAESPSLHAFVRDAIVAGYADTIVRADMEAGPIGFPLSLPFTPEQALSVDFLPADFDVAPRV